MFDIYGSHLANEILVLENDHNFCTTMENLTAQITPAFYKLKRISDHRNKDLVVAFSQDSGFMSYSVQEMYNSCVADAIHKHLRANGLNPLYGEDHNILKGHFIQYYREEILIGNSFISSRTLSILNARSTGTSKAQIARDHDVSIYNVNKQFDYFPQDAYNRFLEVLNRKPYNEVMKEALNATEPHKAQELREREAKRN